MVMPAHDPGRQSPSNGLARGRGNLESTGAAGPGSRAGGRTGAARIAPPVLLFVFTIVTPLVLVAYPLSGASAQRSPLVLILQWAVILYAAARLTMLSWHGEPRWMAIVFWCFTYAWFGVASLAQVMSGHTPLQTAIDDDLAGRELLAILLGFVCYDVAGHLLRPRAMDRAGHEVRILSVRRVAQLGVLAVAATPIITSTLGGIDALFSSRKTVDIGLITSGLYDRSLTKSGLNAGSGNAVGGLLVAVGHTLPFVAMFSLVWLWRSDRASRKKIGLQVLFVLLLGSNLILNNPISSARYWFLTVVLAFIFTIPRLQRRAGITATIVAFILGATIVFPHLDAFRDDRVLFEGRQPVELFTEKTDYGAVTDIALAIRFTDRHGHTDGRQLLGTALFWVPRALWPGKPPNTAYLIATDINFPNTNLDSPLWAEGFFDFGWPGVALLLGAFGVVSSRMDYRYVYARQGWGRGDPVPLALLALPCIAAYESIILRGSLLQSMNHLALLVLLLLIVTRIPRNDAPSAMLRGREEYRPGAEPSRSDRHHG
jgi:hypothetical protein